MPITGPIPLPETGMDAFLNALKEGAETKKLQAQANLPFGGANVPGPAGQIVGLEMIKQMYGEGSPQYKQASDAFNLGQEGVRSRVDYQNILSGTAPKRFSTPLGKSIQEYEDVKAGYMPGTRTPLTDEQQEFYKGKYGLSVNKSTTDADTRKRNLYGRNVDVTLSKIDPQALTQYSGLAGAAKLLKERSAAQTGKASPEYKAYENSLTNAKLLAKQVRQFYGDSITPGVQEGLKQLTNPSTWLKSPEIAKQNYNSFVNTLKAEQKTYQQAMQSPDVYTGNNPEQEGSSPVQGGNTPDTIGQGVPKIDKNGNAIIYKDGTKYSIPLDKVDEALLAGGSLGN